MKRIAALVLTVFLLSLAFTAFARQPVLADEAGNGTGTTIQLPFDLSVLNTLSIAQLKELKKQIENLLEQKEEQLKDFSGIVTAYDGSSLTVQGDNETKVFTVTASTEINIASGDTLQPGYKVEVKYDSNTNEAISVKIEKDEPKEEQLEDFSGVVTAYDGNSLTVQGKNETKVFKVTASTKMNTASGDTLQPGYKVEVKYDSNTNEAISVKAERVVLEYTGTVVSYNSNAIVVSRGNGDQKTFNLSNATQIIGIGKDKSQQMINPGMKVSVKYDLAGNALTIKVLPAQNGKEDKKGNNESKKGEAKGVKKGITNSNKKGETKEVKKEIANKNKNEVKKSTTNRNKNEVKKTTSNRNKKEVKVRGR